MCVCVGRGVCVCVCVCVRVCMRERERSASLYANMFICEFIKRVCVYYLDIHLYECVCVCAYVQVYLVSSHTLYACFVVLC